VRLALPPPRTASAQEQLSDAEAAGLVREGDGSALSVIYSRYGGVCFRLAQRITSNAGLAEDIVQEVFVALWRGKARFDADRGRLDTFLLTLTHHKAVDAVRRESARTRRQTTLELVEEPAAPMTDVALQQTVRAALLRLPEAQREVTVLAYFGGYTHQEIARLTDTPVGTVKTRLLAGMQRLRADFAAMNQPTAGDRR